MTLKDQITEQEIKVHTAITRLLTGGPIYPLPTPLLTENDCPFAFKDTRKGVVKRSKKNMYFKKSSQTRVTNPFLSSDENDESTEEENLCDETCNADACLEPIGQYIQWVQQMQCRQYLCRIMKWLIQPDTECIRILE